MAGTFCPRSVAGSGYCGTAAVCPTRKSRCTCSTATRSTFYSPRGRPAHTPPLGTLDSRTHCSLKRVYISMATRGCFTVHGAGQYTLLSSVYCGQSNTLLVKRGMHFHGNQADILQNTFLLSVLWTNRRAFLFKQKTC